MTYLLYDSALNGLHTLVQLQAAYPINQSLFKGTKDEMLIDVAPYLFEIDDSFEEKLATGKELSLEGLVIVETDKDLKTLCNHFKEFIYQKIKGREYFFRFWDGRYLQRFLPTCEEIQLQQFFGPVQFFIMEEDGTSRALRCSSDNYQLKTEYAVAARISDVFKLRIRELAH